MGMMGEDSVAVPITDSCAKWSKAPSAFIWKMSMSKLVVQLARRDRSASGYGRAEHQYFAVSESTIDAFGMPSPSDMDGTECAKRA